VFGETIRAFRTAAMDMFDAAGQANQLRELIAVALVKARQDVFGQLSRGSCAPVLFRVLWLQ